MYFVDKDKLTQKITYLQKLTEDYNDNKRNLYAFERIGQMLIESSVDIGNMIIDGFNRYFRIGKCYFKRNTITYQSNY